MNKVWRGLLWSSFFALVGAWLVGTGFARGIVWLLVVGVFVLVVTGYVYGLSNRDLEVVVDEECDE